MKRRDFIKTSSLAFLGITFYACNPFRNVQLITNSKHSKTIKDTAIGIIGSGITGLTIAALLAKYGYRVIVFESNPEYFGGHARVLNINNNKFSAGPQYIWDFGEGEIGNRVLKYLDLDDKIPFELMNKDSFENYFVGNNAKVVIPMGLDNYRNKLIDIRPKEKKEITDFFYYLNHLFIVTKYISDELLYIEDYSSMKMKIFATSKISNKSKLIANKMGKWSLSDLFDYCNISQATRRLLYGNGGIFAENESTVSLGIYAAAIGYYHKGAYIPKNGFSSLINGLVNSIRDNGGKLYLNNSISKINSEKKKVVSLTNTRNDNYPVDIVISNISPKLTCHLLDKCNKQALDYEPSNSLISCFIELKDYATAKKELKGKNYWWQHGDNEVNFVNPNMLEPPEMLCIGAPSDQKDNESLIIFAPGSFDQSKLYFEKGEGAYDAFKETIWELILNKLDETIFPEIRSHIKSVTLYTPYDLHTQLNAEKGNVYGKRGNFENLSKAIYNVSSIQNLYLANATIGSPGVAPGFQLSTLLFSKLTGKTI
ncbi:MAG: NAD(P)/FAD-dependent oxidoreductase [Bacteroidales bacterium]|nr:NAD(P)/FAD-dependent oxidoreductase [Bacteroidales bacterium]